MVPGSPAQLVFGLIVCYATSCAYSGFKPLRDEGDDFVQQLAQAEVFFALVSSIVQDWVKNDNILDVLMVVLLFVPPGVAILSELGLDRLLKVCKSALTSGSKPKMTGEKDGAAGAVAKHLGSRLKNVPPAKAADVSVDVGLPAGRLPTAPAVEEAADGESGRSSISSSRRVSGVV